MQSLFKVIKSAPVEDKDQVLPLRQLTIPVPVPDNSEEPSASPEELLMLAEHQAQEITSRAKQEAAQILQQTKLEAEMQAQELKEQAKQAGWQEGIHASEVEAEEIRGQARSVLNQAREIYHQTLAKMESEIVDLAVDIAERVVMAQLAVEPRTVMEIARECMELVKNRPLVNIYVNDADFTLVKDGKNELLQGLPGRVELNILVDKGIQPGGCRIETEQGQVDATLETRWQEVTRALYGQEE